MLYNLLNKKFPTNLQHLGVEMFWIYCRPLHFLWICVRPVVDLLCNKSYDKSTTKSKKCVLILTCCGQQVSNKLTARHVLNIQYVYIKLYKYRNGLWPMQYVFLIRSSAGGKKYVTRRSRVTYFLQPARERIKSTYCMGHRPFLFLLLIYMRVLTIFYAKF